MGRAADRLLFVWEVIEHTQAFYHPFIDMINDIPGVFVVLVEEYNITTIIGYGGTGFNVEQLSQGVS